MTINIHFTVFAEVYTVVQNFRSGISGFHYAGMPVLCLLYHFHLAQLKDHSLVYYLCMYANVYFLLLLNTVCQLFAYTLSDILAIIRLIYFK